jgi:hypothetical protein
VTPFTPDLVAVGLGSTVQVDAAAATTVSFQIVNQGGAPVTGATLSIDDPASLGLACLFDEPFVLCVPPALGDIGPGEARLVSFTVLAGTCADLTVGTQIAPFTTTLVANEGTWTFPVTLQVNAAPQTSLTVSVEDVASWWASNGAFLGGGGPGLVGAVVTITDAAGVSQSLVADSGGNTFFTGLTAGVFAVDIAPPVAGDGHLDWHGSVLVPAGQATSFEAYLPVWAQSYELVATPDALGFLDYDLVTTTVGPAEAPALEVQGEGALLDLDLAVGETAQFELTLVNTGAPRLEALELFTADLADYTIAPHTLFLGDLAKAASLPVVITVTRTGLGDACDLGGAHFGVRGFVQAAEPVWFWTPLFVASGDASAGCAAAVAGGAPPTSLPPPLAAPPAGPMLPPTAPYLGDGLATGATPSTPVRPAPPTLTLPL